MDKIELKSFVIAVDRPQPVYRPGERVNGNCLIHLNGQLDLSELKIQLIGLAEVKWTETETRSTTHDKSRHTEHVVYHATHPCIELTYFPGSVYQTVVTSGEHNIGFNFQLPISNVVSSYEGTYGHIRYWIEATIRKPQLLCFDHKTTFAITVMSPAFASIQELNVPVNNTNQKTVGIFSSATVILRASINRNGQTIGSTIAINCSVENQSKKSMSIRATLIQEITFYARGKHKQTVDKLVRVVGNSIASHSNVNEVLSLLIPNTAAILYNQSPIIKVRHFIKVTLDIPGSFDLHCELPIILTNQVLTFDYN